MAAPKKSQQQNWIDQFVVDLIVKPTLHIVGETLARLDAFVVDLRDEATPKSESVEQQLINGRAAVNDLRIKARTDSWTLNALNGTLAGASIVTTFQKFLQFLWSWLARFEDILHRHLSIWGAIKPGPRPRYGRPNHGTSRIEKALVNTLKKVSAGVAKLRGQYQKVLSRVDFQFDTVKAST